MSAKLNNKNKYQTGFDCDVIGISWINCVSVLGKFMFLVYSALDNKTYNLQM